MKQFIIAFLFCFFLAATSQAQTITGIVSNGTTGKLSAGDEVTLIKLGQGMEELATTKTNGRGEFTIKGDDPKAPYLVRVTHAGVNYHTPVRPGSSGNLDITVYDAAQRVSGIRLLEQSEVYQARPDSVQAIALFRLSNDSSPKLTQPTFEFYLPEGATIRMGQALRPDTGMPTQTQPTKTREANKYSVDFPLRPGVTQYEIVYTMPYSGKLERHPKLTMNAEHYYVVTAKGIAFKSAGSKAFQATDVWPTDPSITGIDIHSIEGVKQGQDIAYEITGTGLMPEQAPAQSQSAQNGQQQPQEDTRPGGGLGIPNEKPDPLHSGQWAFLGVLTLFLAAGATYVYTTNNHQVSGAPAKKAQNVSGNLLLEAMKEEMFQLETERLQGKISGKDYEAARAALDKTLQRAVQRQKH